MAKASMNDPGQSGPPNDFPNVTPEIAGAGQTRILIDAMKESLADLKDDVGRIEASIDDIKGHRYTDLILYGKALAGAVVVLAGVAITAYMRLEAKIERLEDRIQALSTTSTRVDTKLEDLLQRIPPAITPVPKR
jgi:prefoldin subunit 5